MSYQLQGREFSGQHVVSTVLRPLATMALAASCLGAGGVAHATDSWMQEVNSIVGATGKTNPDGSLTWNLIRPELSFQIQPPGGTPVSLLPTMAAGVLGFQAQSSGQVLMTLEFPLQESEVQTFTESLNASGVRVTALHNHYLFDNPRIVFVHADALGSPNWAAQAAKTAWSKIPTTLDTDGIPDSDDNVTGLDVGAIGQTIGGTADALDGVVDVTVPRRDNVTDTFGSITTSLPSELGPQSDFEFQPLGNNNAYVVGEVCVNSNEVGTVSRSLRSSGFTLTAEHNHFVNESPRLFFIHFEGSGNASTLASAIHTAVAMTNSNLK